MTQKGRKKVAWISRMFPEIDMDVGTVVHFIYGFLAPVLGFLIDNLPFVISLFTVIFVLKQFLDVYGGEVPKITGGDISEFASGLVVGLILVAVGSF